MKRIYTALVLMFILLLSIQAQVDTALINQYLKIAYLGLSDQNMYGKDHWAFGEFGADNSEVGGENKTDGPSLQNLMLYNNTPCNSELKQFWNDAYTIIYHSNLVILYSPSSALTDSLKNQYMAEAKFLRSLMYFELTCIFDSVPLCTDTAGLSAVYSYYSNSQAAATVTKKRNSLSEIFAQNISDLNDAITKLPKKSALPSFEKYKATKGAAKALLTKIYLYQSSYAKNYPGDSRFTGLTQQWDKVLQLSEEIINSGEYQLPGYSSETYSTWWDSSYLFPGKTPGFRYIFTVAGNDCPESVFEVRDLYKTGYTSYGGNLITIYCSTRRFINQSGSLSTLGWGFNCPSSNLVNEFAKESGNAKDDPRFAVTVAENGDSILGYNSSALKNQWFNMNFTSSPTSMYNRKYECSPDEYWKNLSIQWNGPFNIRVIRYADVILWAAEAALQLDSINKATGYINMVRTRARNSGSTGYPQDLTTAAFADLVHERSLELAMEGSRFFDLVRWNLTDSLINGHFNSTFATTVTFTHGVNEFFPLPDNATRLSKGLITQNPGYDTLCAFLYSIPDIYTKLSNTKNVISMVGAYSGNGFAKPSFSFSSTIPDFASFEIINDTLNINYSHPHKGEIDTVTLTMSYNGGSMNTKFRIFAVDPVNTLNDTSYYKFFDVFNTNISSTSIYNTLGLNKDTTTLVVFPANEISFRSAFYIQRIYYSGVNDYGIQLMCGDYTLQSIAESLKSRPEYIDLLIVFKNRYTKKVIKGVEKMVKLTDILPEISISGLKSTSVGNTIKVPISTSFIDTVNLDKLNKKYYPNYRGFMFYFSYDTTKLKYKNYDVTGTLIGSSNNNISAVLDSNKILNISDSTAEPFYGRGKLINLNFEVLTDGDPELKINKFYYYVYNPGRIWDSYVHLVNPTWEQLLNQIKTKSIVTDVLKIYPNPAKNYLKIENKLPGIKINIIDLQGRIIIQQILKAGIFEIDISRLAKGIYLVTSEYGNNHFFGKLIKE